MQLVIIPLLLLGVAMFALETDAIVCTPNICDTVRCRSIDSSTCDGVFKPKGGFCGCCDVCVAIIKEGERCFTFKGVPPTAECEEGTHCKENTCVGMY